MAKVYILIGGNIGDRELELHKAKKFITETIEEIILKSSIYETEAWGFNSDKKFLNQVIVIETECSPEEILNKSNAIERKMGRKKQQHYSSRTIDIDILFYDNLILNSKNLVIPHEKLHERRFTLMPLNEIAADFIHPVFNKTIEQLLKQNTDKLDVKIYK